MYQLPLNALRAFAAVYSTGGVRRAARTLGISHSSVSRHLTELEAWLGAALTEKSAGRRGLALTADGEALGRAARDALASLENATLQIKEARTSLSVAVSVAPSFAGRWLLPRLPNLEKRHPKIEVSVSVDQRPVQPEAGRVDIAIRMTPRPPPDLNAEPLMDDSLYPVMSVDFWKRAGQPTEPAELSGLRLIHDRDPNTSWGVWRRSFGPDNLDVRSGPRFASSDLVLRAAAQSQGVALARHRLVQEDISAGILIRPMKELSVPLGTSYWLLLPERPREPRPAVRVTIEWLKSVVDAYES